MKNMQWVLGINQNIRAIQAHAQYFSQKSSAWLRITATNFNTQ